MQATVLNISEKQNDYVLEVTGKLQAAGFAVDNDLRNEKIGYKIREHIGKRTPYLLVVGDKEMENGTLSVRKRGQKADVGTFTLAEVIAMFNKENHPNVE